MKHERVMERRRFLTGAVGAASLVAFSGCDNLTQSSWFPAILNKVERLTELVQRAVTPRDALAKEYDEADISAVFPANGNTDPGTEAYAEHVGRNFSGWMLEVIGLVKAPRSWSLASLKELPPPHADYPSRLCGGLERDREVDRCPGRRFDTRGRTIAECTLCGVSLCRRGR